MKPMDIASRILEWEERGRLVDDESWVQNNAPALANEYVKLYVLLDALGTVEPAGRCCGRGVVVWAGNPPAPSHEECCGSPEYDFEGAFKKIRALLADEPEGLPAEPPSA